MRIYISGWQSSTPERELEVLKSGYIKYRCFSFTMLEKVTGLVAYVKHLQGSYELNLKYKVGIMMDSGVFSYRNYQSKLIKAGAKAKYNKLPTEDQFIEQYVEYYKKNEKLWDFGVTCDMDKNAEEILRRHCKIEQMGIRPVPVYHGDSSLDFIRKYHDKGYNFICLGNTHRTKKLDESRFLHSCFDLGEKLGGMTFHGLAMTSAWNILSFPWWSVDSSSWSRCATFGSIMRFDELKHRVTQVHVSDKARSGSHTSDLKLNKSVVERLVEELKGEGFDYKELQTSMVQRHIYNARTTYKLGEYAKAKDRTGRFKLLF